MRRSFGTPSEPSGVSKPSHTHTFEMRVPTPTGLLSGCSFELQELVPAQLRGLGEARATRRATQSYLSVRMDPTPRIRVGVVGYGSLGKYLVDAILDDPACSSKFELAFVWNRTAERVIADARIPAECRLADLDDFASKGADLIAEVSHPSITASHGARFLSGAHFFCGSPTAFADPAVEAAIFGEARNATGFGLVIPVGAMWGAPDIQKMSDSGSLRGLTVTMKKHPGSLKLNGELATRLQEARAGPAADDGTEEVELYCGPVRELCPMAPNNVNTMACAALAAASSLGMDGTVGRLVCDPRLDAHVIEIEVVGPGDPAFKVTTTRFNPAKPGAVTGNATYKSFLSSMIVAGAAGLGNGLHLC